MSNVFPIRKKTLPVPSFKLRSYSEMTSVERILLSYFVGLREQLKSQNKKKEIKS